MEIPSNPIFIAGQIAVKSMEKKNSNISESNLIKKNIEKNHIMMNEFVSTLPEIERKNHILKDKDNIIAEKQKILSDLQQTLLQTKESKLNSSSSIQQNSNQTYEPIPIVVSKLFDLLYKLSESAITNKNNLIPLQSLLTINDSIEQLIDLCYKEGFIIESQEKNEQRKEENKIIKESINDHLKQIQVSQEEEEENDEENGIYI